MKQQVNHIGIWSIVAFVSVFGFQNCGGFNASAPAAPVAATDPLSAPVLSSGNGTFLPPRATDPNDVVFTSSCPNGESQGVQALSVAIQAMAAPSDQTTTATFSYGTINCQAGLGSFSVRSVDAYGNTITMGQISNSDYIHVESNQSVGLTAGEIPTVGLGCDFHYNAANIDNIYQMDLNWFVMYGLKGNGSEQVYMCVAGTDPLACGPTSANFIGGFAWGTGTQGNTDDQASGSNATLTAVSVGFTSVSNTDTVDSNVISEIFVSGGQTFAGTTLNQCDAVGVYSPLVIEKVAGQGIKTLNPYAKKTYFDLTGDGTKDRISCVSQGAFLALPNASGEIVNINQLFGNNTVGPDGQKAANGFLALAKYDHKSASEGYGTILPSDSIYSQLRLWQDSNCDGIAQASELQPLQAWNITGINWINAVPVMEMDAYGNETKERSFVDRSSGGATLRVFDLWFLANYGTQP